MDIAGKVLKMRRDGHDLIKMIGGRRRPSQLGPARRRQPRHQRGAAQARSRSSAARPSSSPSSRSRSSTTSCSKNTEYVELITGDVYVHSTYNMGTVDANNCVNFYDGKIRVVGPDGSEHAKYDARDYRDYIAERVEPWTLPEVPLPEEGRLEGVGRRPGLGRLQGHAAVAAERRRRHGHAAGQGRVQADSTRPWAASRSITRWPPTGPG